MKINSNKRVKGVTKYVRNQPMRRVDFWSNDDDDD